MTVACSAGMLDQIDPSRPVPEQRIPFHVRDGFTAGTVTTQMFWDSDIAKTIEAAAYALYRRRDPEIEALMDEVIDMYRRLQQPDGYCSSWYIRMQPGRRWTNLRDCHELYCAGHMIEAAVAYAQATGKRTFLEVMCRYADHIATVFGPNEGQLRGYCGHEEIELALVKLARETGEQKYMDLARFFIDERGSSRITLTRKRTATGGTRSCSTSRPMNTTSRTCPCGNRPRSWVTRCGRCIFIPAWRTSRRNMATTR